MLLFLGLCAPARADIVQEESAAQASGSQKGAPQKTVPRASVRQASARLADYGIYTADVSAPLRVAADIALQKKTYRVPIKPGLLFGIRFVLAAAPTKELAVTVRITLPPPEDVQAAKQPAYIHTRTLLPGQLYFEGLQISTGAPFAPGIYTFELLLHDTVLLARTFELYQEPSS